MQLREAIPVRPLVGVAEKGAGGFSVINAKITETS